MPNIVTNNPDNTLSANYFTFLTNLLYRSSYLHNVLPFIKPKFL